LPLGGVVGAKVLTCGDSYLVPRALDGTLRKMIPGERKSKFYSWGTFRVLLSP
jgi:hypothetical protein